MPPQISNRDLLWSSQPAAVALNLLTFTTGSPRIFLSKEPILLFGITESLSVLNSDATPLLNWNAIAKNKKRSRRSVFTHIRLKWQLTFFPSYQCQASLTLFSAYWLSSTLTSNGYYARSHQYCLLESDRLRRSS